MFKPLEVSKTGLDKEVIKKIQVCLAAFPDIEQAILYGSRAKGNFRNGSDIDLCLLGENLDSSFILKLDHQLDELMLPYRFDLSIYSQIDNPNFKDHIDRVGVIFFQKR